MAARGYRVRALYVFLLNALLGTGMNEELGSNNFPRFEVFGFRLPHKVKAGDDLAKLIVNTALAEGVAIENGDVIVITSKVLLKALGKTFRLRKVKPSLAARIISRITGKDPREVELILRASEDIVAVVPLRGIRLNLLSKIAEDINEALNLLEKIPSLLVVVTKQGLIALDGGLITPTCRRVRP